MPRLTDYFENKLIDWLLRQQAFSVAGATAGAGSGMTSLYFGLLSTLPTDSAGGAELSGSNYSRAAYSSSLANWAGTQGPGTTAVSSGTSGQTSNNTKISFSIPSANWVTAVAMGLWDAPTGGNLLIFSPLSAPTICLAGKTPVFAIGNFLFQLDT